MEQQLDLDRQRLGRAMANTPEGLVVECVDGKARTWPDGREGVLPGDIVALGGDNRVRAYVSTPDGTIPKEALDTQIFAEVRSTGKVVGLQPRGEQERINARNELQARYLAQSRVRTLELAAAAVLHISPTGQVGLSDNWKAAYVRERQSAALSPLAEAPAASKYQGVIREIGVLNKAGQRGIALDTPKGNAIVATSISRAAPGSVVEFERGSGNQPWAMKTVGQETAKKVLEEVKKLHKDIGQRQRDIDREMHDKRKKGRSRSDMGR